MLTPEERALRIERYASAPGDLDAALGGIPRAAWTYKPGPERWSIHETLIHLADSEASSYIRLRRGLAEPGGAVTAYDEDRWAARLRYHEQSVDDAKELFGLLRRMSLDDWLVVYSDSVAQHAGQIRRTYAAFVAEQRGERPDPSRSLFRP